MQSKSAALRDQINELDAKIQGASNLSERNQLEAERNELNNQLQVALAEEAQQQERAQAQTDMVESITLAYDYNDLLGHPDANETIIENIKQYRLQDSEEHYAEVSRINADHKDMLDTLLQASADVSKANREDREQLQQRLNAETEQARMDAIEIIELSQQVAQLGLEKQEAETSRDNAARLLAEANEEIEKHKQASIENIDLKAQIEALKQELTAKKALTVSGNEKLAELAAKAKESTAAAAQRGIERWNQQYGMDIPVLEVPEVQPVNAVLEEEAPAQEIPFQIEEELRAAAATMAEGSPSSDREVDETESEVITLATIDITPVTKAELSKRLSDFRHEMINELESQYGLVRGQVA